MAEKSIRFDTPMVQAVLEGRKTQARRVIKPQPAKGVFIGICTDSTNKKDIGKVGFGDDCSVNQFIRIPYQLGDILYVQETWCEYVSEHIVDTKYAYRADATPNSERMRQDYIKCGYPYTWKPSINMPREAARIFQRVTDVRAERLQDMSEADAKAEGIRSYFLHKEHGGEWHESNSTFVGVENSYPTRRQAFSELWDSIYTKCGHVWDANPWVWVYEFERVMI